MEEKACVEVRGQLGGRSLTWVFPIVGGGEAPGELRVFSISCPAKSSTREDFEVRERFFGVGTPEYALGFGSCAKGTRSVNRAPFSAYRVQSVFKL